MCWKCAREPARKPMQNIVIDANVFISALLKSRNCSEVLEALKCNRFHLIISEKLIDEVLDVAENPKFEFTGHEKNELRELLNIKASIVVPSEKIHVSRDPKDNPVIECAVCGKADFIVTGDKDLLSLKTFRKIPIITPREFLEILT